MPTIKKGIICEDENLQNKIYPYTQMDCVYDSDNSTTLDAVVDDIKENLMYVDELGTYQRTVPIDADLLEGHDTNYIIEKANTFSVLNGVDLNDIQYFYMGYVQNASGNAPTTTVEGYLLVVPAAGLDRCFQIWKSRTSNNIYHRYYINNAWSTWVQLQNVS